MPTYRRRKNLILRTKNYGITVSNERRVSEKEKGSRKSFGWSSNPKKKKKKEIALIVKS
jgi:hypothetical protein